MPDRYLVAQHQAEGLTGAQFAVLVAAFLLWGAIVYVRDELPRWRRRRQWKAERASSRARRRRAA